MNEKRIAMIEKTIGSPDYDRLREEITKRGGTMDPVRGGYSGGGCEWVIHFEGRRLIVQCRINFVNMLDLLYVPNVPKPKTWNDYAEDALLAPDWFWKFTATMLAHSEEV